MVWLLWQLDWSAYVSTPLTPRFWGATGKPFCWERTLTWARQSSLFLEWESWWACQWLRRDCVVKSECWLLDLVVFQKLCTIGHIHESNLHTRFKPKLSSSQQGMTSFTEAKWLESPRTTIQAAVCMWPCRVVCVDIAFCLYDCLPWVGICFILWTHIFTPCLESESIQLTSQPTCCWYKSPCTLLCIALWIL